MFLIPKNKNYEEINFFDKSLAIILPGLKHYGAQAGLKLVVILPPSAECLITTPGLNKLLKVKLLSCGLCSLF